MIPGICRGRHHVLARRGNKPARKHATIRAQAGGLGVLYCMYLMADHGSLYF